MVCVLAFPHASLQSLLSAISSLGVRLVSTLKAFGACLDAHRTESRAIATQVNRYVSMRQQTSAYASVPHRTESGDCDTSQTIVQLSAYVSIRQHTSAYVELSRAIATQVNR
jgi:hypothetical protein